MLRITVARCAQYAQKIRAPHPIRITLINVKRTQSSVGGHMKQGSEQQLPWFSADFTGRELSASERDFIKALSVMLDRGRPPQVAPANTSLTAEGQGCLIAIIPHSLLAGVSINSGLAGFRGVLRVLGPDRRSQLSRRSRLGPPCRTICKEGSGRSLAWRGGPVRRGATPPTN